MLLFRQFKLLLINQIQKTIFLHSMDDLHTHTHTLRIYIVNKINGAQSFLRSWRLLSQSRNSSPLMRTKVHYVAHNSPLYMRTCVTSCNTQVLQLTNCETLWRTNTVFLKETINFEGYPWQIFHSFFEYHQFRNISLHYRGSTG
jgi:hypothetical protein